MKKIIIGILLTTCLSISAFGQLFTNTYHQTKNISSLKTERYKIFMPNEDWHYVHHPSIAYFKGTFYAIFSNGISGEDDPGQRVMITQSDDLKRWSSPRILQQPVMGEYGVKKVLTPGGIMVIENKLVVYFTDNDMDGKSYRRYNPMLYATTSEDGKNWSDPIKLNIPVFPCHHPSILQSGRLLLTGNRKFYFTDNVSGTEGWQSSAKEELPNPDEYITFSQVNPSLCEGSILQHRDGSIHTIFRSTGKTYDGFLWQTTSKDNGCTWTEPIHSNFTDANSKSHFGTLPDGRYYYVGTPDTITGGLRHPLVLSISDDGFLFDKHYVIGKDYYVIKYKGKWKNGDFGYPFTLLHDNYLLVIVSRQKEKLELIKIDLNEISKDR